ncbi:MAG: RtcB family protein [Candidatus Moranbacteria bacterium]|nr:RtcB family protein [Candidatus Moranbacteria bacterium]
MRIKKESPYKQVLEPTNNQKVPVIFHISDDLMPDNATIDQLACVASAPHIFHHVSALTDVHQKPGRRNPSGSVVATEKFILPQLVDSAPNCGMRMIKTPFDQESITSNQIDKLFRELVKVIPTKTYWGTYLDHKTTVELSLKGSQAILEKFDRDLTQLKYTFMKGNAFSGNIPSEKDLFAALPKLFFRIAQFRSGILGMAGNHFLDLMKVTDVINKEKAEKMGIKKNQYMFLLHTGSGLFGQYSSYFYMPKVKEHASQKIVLKIGQSLYSNRHQAWFKQLKKDLVRYKTAKDFFTIDEDSELGRNFLIANQAAANHGYANRALLQINLEKAIEKVWGKKIQLPLIYDMTHVSIQKEAHFGKDVWVHRSNVSRAFGPSKMEKDSPYKEMGEPVFVPSSMSTPAYLGTATDNNQETFYSAAHGTGKSKYKTSKAPADKKELFEKMKDRGVKLYNAASANIIDQDSAHYKNVEMAIEGMKANGIIDPIVKMMPVAVLMA